MIPRSFDRDRLVVFHFAERRVGRHPAQFLQGSNHDPWLGTRVCDDYSRYKALFAAGVN